MESSLVFKRRISSQLQISEQEREEIAKRIIAFMKSCLVVEHYINEPENKSQSRFKNYHFNFAGKTFGSYYFRLYEKDGKIEELSEEDLLYKFTGGGWGDEGMFGRFKYQIRMNASMVHIKKLVELLGKDVAIFYLNSWAKRNFEVAIILEKYIQEIKEMENGR